MSDNFYLGTDAEGRLVPTPLAQAQIAAHYLRIGLPFDPPAHWATPSHAITPFGRTRALDAEPGQHYQPCTAKDCSNRDCRMHRALDKLLRDGDRRGSDHCSNGIGCVVENGEEVSDGTESRTDIRRFSHGADSRIRATDRLDEIYSQMRGKMNRSTIIEPDAETARSRANDTHDVDAGLNARYAALKGQPLKINGPYLPGGLL